MPQNHLQRQRRDSFRRGGYLVVVCCLLMMLMGSAWTQQVANFYSSAIDVDYVNSFVGVWNDGMKVLKREVISGSVSFHQEWTCFGLAPQDVSVCNSRGMCVAQDTCLCGDENYASVDCSKTGKELSSAKSMPKLVCDWDRSLTFDSGYSTPPECVSSPIDPILYSNPIDTHSEDDGIVCSLEDSLFDLRCQFLWYKKEISIDQESYLYEQDLGYSFAMYYNGNVVVRRGRRTAITCYRCLLGTSNGFTGKGLFVFKRELDSLGIIEDTTAPSLLVNDFTFKFYFTMLCNKKDNPDCESDLQGRNQTLFEFVTVASWKVFINQDRMLSIHIFPTDYTLTVPEQLNASTYYYIVIVKSPQTGLSVYINEEKKYQDRKLIQDWDCIQPPPGFFNLMGRSNNGTDLFEGEIENFELDPRAKDELELKSEFKNATYGVKYVETESVCSGSSCGQVYPVWELLSYSIPTLVVNYSNIEKIEIEIPDINIPPFIRNRFSEEKDVLHNFISVSFNTSDQFIVYTLVRGEITETGMDEVRVVDLRNMNVVTSDDVPIEEYKVGKGIKCKDGYYGIDCKYSSGEEIITIYGDPFFVKNQVFRNISQFNSTDSSVHVETVYFVTSQEFYITNHSRFLVKDCSLVDSETILLFDKSLSNASDYFMILYKKVNDHYVEDVYVSLTPKSRRISNNVNVVMIGDKEWILVDRDGDEMIYFMVQIETGNTYPIRVVPNHSEQQTLNQATTLSTNGSFIQLFVNNFSNNTLSTTLVSLNDYKDIIISENDFYFDEITFYGDENVSLISTNFPLIYIIVETDEFLYLYQALFNSTITQLVGRENLKSTLMHNQLWYIIDDQRLLLIDQGELRFIQTNTSNLVKVSYTNNTSLSTVDDFDQVIERFNIHGVPFLDGHDISLVELNYENGNQIQRNISFIHNMSLNYDTIVTESPLSIPCSPDEILLIFYQPNTSFSIMFEKESDNTYIETMMTRFKPRISLSSSFKVIHLDGEIWFGMDYFKNNISYYRISDEEVVGYDEPISLDDFGFTSTGLVYLHSITIRNGTDFMNYIASVSNSSVNVMTVSGGRSKPLSSSVREFSLVTELNSTVKVICDRDGTNLYLLIITDNNGETSLIELFRFEDEQLVNRFVFESSVISIRKDREPTSKWFIIGSNGIIVIDLDEIQNPLLWFGDLDFDGIPAWQEDDEIFYYQPVIDTPIDDNNVTISNSTVIGNNSIVSNRTEENYSNTTGIIVHSNTTAENHTNISQNTTIEEHSNNTTHSNMTEYANQNTTYSQNNTINSQNNTINSQNNTINSQNNTIDRENTTFIDLNKTISVTNVTHINSTTENTLINTTISINQTHEEWANRTLENNSSTFNMSSVDGSSNNSVPQTYSPVITCFGKHSYDDMTCSSKGVCISNNTCECLFGYEGIMCEIPTCFGVNATDNEVCNKNGKCRDLDTCECDAGFSGSKCQFLSFVEKQCGGSFVKSYDFVIIDQDLMYESVLTDQLCGKSILIGRLNITSIPFSVINSTSKTEIISNLISTYNDGFGNLYISFDNSLQTHNEQDELFFKVIDLTLFNERVLQLPISNIDDVEYSKIGTPRLFGQVRMVNANGDLFGLTVSSLGYVVVFSIQDDRAIFLAFSYSITTYSLLSKGNTIYSQNKTIHSKYVFITSTGTASLITLGAGQTNFTDLSAPSSDNGFSILIANPNNGKQFWFTLSKEGVNVSSIVPNIEAEIVSYNYLASDKDFTATNEKELKVETSVEYTIISNVVTGLSFRIENYMLEEVSNIFAVSVEKSTSVDYFAVSDSTTEEKLQIDNISPKILPTYEPMVFTIYGSLDLPNTQLELNLLYNEESIASFKVVKTGTNEYSTLIQSIKLSPYLESLGSFEVNSEIIILDNTYSTSTFIPIPFNILLYNRVRVVDVFPKVAFKGENVYVQGSFYPSNRLSARISYGSQTVVTMDVEAQYVNSTFALLLVPDLVDEVNVEVNLQIMIPDMNIISTLNEQSIFLYVDPEITIGKYSLDQFIVENVYNISGVIGAPIISKVPSLTGMPKPSLLFKLDKSNCISNTSSEIRQVMTSSTTYDLSKKTILDMRFFGLNGITRGSIMQLWFVKQYHTVSIDLVIDQNVRKLVLILPNVQTIETKCNFQENTHYQFITEVQNGQIQIKIYEADPFLTLCSINQDFSSDSLAGYGMAFGQSIDCGSLTKGNTSELIALEILASYQKCASCTLKTSSLPSSYDPSLIAGLATAGVILFMILLIAASFVVHRIRKKRRMMRYQFVYYDRSNEGAQETLADLFNTIEGLSSNEASELTADETIQSESDVSLYNTWV